MENEDKKVTETGSGALGAMADVAKGAREALAAGSETVKETVTETAGTATEAAGAVVEKAAETVETVTETAGTATEAAGAVAGKAAETVEAAKETVTETAGAAAEKAAEVAETVEETVAETVTAAPEAVKDAVSGFGTEAAAAAEAVMPKKSKKPVIIVAAIVICALIGIGVAYAMGAFTKPADQILYAMDKTFVGDDLTNVIGEISDFTKDGVYTMNVDLKYEDEYSPMSADLYYSQDRAAGEQSLSGDLEVMGYSFTVNEYLNDSVMEMSVPELLGDQTLSYPYTTTKTGYVVDMMGQDTLDQLDASLKAVYSAMSIDTSKGNEKVKAAIREDFKTLAFRKADNQDVEIDGAKVSCKGYTATIDKEFMNKLIDDVEAAYGGEEFDDYMDALSTLAAFSGQSTYSGTFDSMREAVDDMPAMDVTFLLNKKKLAGILFKDAVEESSEAEAISSIDSAEEMNGVLFHRSDIPWHDTELVSPASSTSLVVTVEGKTETMSVITDGETGMELVYDIESGTWNLTSGESTISGTLTQASGGYLLSTSVDTMDLDVLIIKGANIVRPASSFVLDLGTMTESDYESLVTTVSNNISAMLGF